MSHAESRVAGLVVYIGVLLVGGLIIGGVFINDALNRLEENDAAIAEFADNAIKQRQQTTYELCEATRENREILRRAVLASSDPTKLQPGDYGYAYAQANPEEALARHQEIVAAAKLEVRGEGPLRLFPPIICTPPGGRPTTEE